MQDLNNRIRDNRAMLGRRKIRFKFGKSFFYEKPALMTTEGQPGITKNSSASQLEEIRTRRKKVASYNQVVVLTLLMLCLALLTGPFT